MRQKLLILGALAAPLGLGTLVLFVTHRWALHGPRYEALNALLFAGIILGLVCYLILLDSWLKRLLLGIVYVVVMTALFIVWGLTFSCTQFGACP